MSASVVRSGVRKLIPYVFLPVAFPDHLLRPAVRILMYHRVARLPAYDQLTVSPERFEEQIAALASRWRVVTLADAVSELEGGGPRVPTAVVTFDDGYLDNLVNALPVLLRHRVPATIFVTARFSDGSHRHPRYASEPGRLHLDWDEIAMMARQPGISIGSHSLTHPYLTRLDDGAALAEVADSRREIAGHTGLDVDFFCYPSGDLTQRERALASAAGYRAAVSVCPGPNRNAGERFALRRTEVTDRDGARELHLKLMGAYDPVHLLLHRRRERAFEQAREIVVGVVCHVRELHMKLLYLMTEPFGIGGVQSDILTLSEDLIGKGHEIFVAATAGVLLDELKAKGTRHLDIDFNFDGLGTFTRAGLRLRQAVADHAIEMVAPQSVRSTIAGYAALRLMPFSYRVASTGRRVPIVTTIHNIHNPMHFRYAGHILQRCTDYVIFESNYERDRLLASGLRDSKSTVIHSGIDTNRFVPRPRDQALADRYGLDPERHKVFGIVARLSEEKGHNYLLEAFAEVHRSRPDARLMVIGDGPLLDKARAQAQQLGVSETVIFTGMQRNIPDYLALLDVFVLSSTRESFPLAAREAMAAGRPVIAPRIGGCPEVVDEGVTGYLFESRNVGQLRDRMLEILGDGRPAAMGRAARERVERLFSRRSWVEGDERVYKSWHQSSA